MTCLKKLMLIGFAAAFCLASFFLTAAQAAELHIEGIPLERNSISLHLQRFLEDDGTEKKPLLLVHGLTYSSHEFDVDYQDYSLARYFARNGFEVWLLDIAGYGNSEPVEDGFLPDSDYAAGDVEAAVRCILARHNLPSMDVLGWSWGTVTSGRFAATHPELVRKLVLYAPIVAGLGSHAVTEPFNQNSWQHAAGDFQTSPDGSIDFSIAEKPVVDTYLSNAWRYDKDSSPNGGRRDLLTDEQTRLIPTKELRSPVLIISGTKDPYVSPELCEEAFQTLTNPDSKLFILPGASHCMLMEKPYYKIFREKVLEFLKD